MFKHFLLTRFNLKNMEGISGYDKKNKPVLTDKWLENRFELFDNYCFPSIKHQTCNKFIWFVLFSTDTPDIFIKRIKEYEVEFPLFKPLFLESGDRDSIKKAFNREMIKYIDGNDRFVITTRIDNDDAFHEDMILEVQKQFNSQLDSFISFTYGLQYHTGKSIFVRMHYLNNHFISRVEKLNNEEVQTVITIGHTDIDKVANVIYINNRKKLLWLEVIHEGNIINDINPRNFPLFSNDKIRFFHFKLSADILFYNSLVAFYGYVILRIKMLRIDFFKCLGIYEYSKRVFKNNDKLKELKS